MRLLIVVNVDSFFLSHRLPVALGALKAGYEVHIATSLTLGRENLEKYGFIVHSIKVDRASAEPAGLIKLFCTLLTLFWRLRPDILHLVTIKPVLLGGLAARLSPVGGVVYAISGLGHVYLAKGVFAWCRRSLVGAWYRIALGVRNMRIIFQNIDDRREIETVARLRSDCVVMIPGSGVNLADYPYNPVPSGVPVVLMVSRLLSTKGVKEFVEAAHQLRDAGVIARFLLVGEPDTANPASIKIAELNLWKKQGVVELLGHRTDISALMAKSHVVVLPSYREGLPKVLIEAAACGRAVVTTDVPGCRDAIEPNVTGIIVPPRDSKALAQGIKLLLENDSLLDSMGLAARRRAERLFDVNVIVDMHLKVYWTLLRDSIAID